jgi:hypothetical protein
MCGRQALAPFGATAFEDELTALRAHADAEAVRLGAAAIVRLKSSLRHTLHLSINVSTEKGKPIETGGGLSSFARHRQSSLAPGAIISGHMRRGARD